jgi:hypothetical protein
MSARALKVGAICLYSWSALNFFLSSLILVIVVMHFGNSPLLRMVFEEPRISGFDADVILVLNCLTILYNSYAVAFSVLVCLMVRFGLGKGEKWVFWALVVTMGFVEVFAFIASAPLGNVRWQVNVVLTALYVAGIGLSGYPMLRPRT